METTSLTSGRFWPSTLHLSPMMPVRFASDTPAIPRNEPEVLQSARLLLDAGANVNGANTAGDTALHAAAASTMSSVIQLLADRGSKLDVKNKQGLTPLALTLVAGAARGRPLPGATPEPSPRAKAAEELLRKLGAIQ